MNMKDIVIPENSLKTLLLDKHANFIESYSQKKDYEYHISEYLRMSGIYWGLTSLTLIRKKELINKQEVLDFIQKCYHENGGFSASIGHDPHILYTLSAIQILCLYDSLDQVKVNKIVEYIKSLQQIDGSFFGDKWGEVDTRFSFCAVACLALLGRLGEIDKENTIEFVLSCMNYDGGFGCRPSSESHSGQIFCCVGLLSIYDHLHVIDSDKLGWWLCERQLKSGGLNGRPEKLPDVCYSWWVLSSLKSIDRLHWINKERLINFILAAQDDEIGGFADRPGDVPDPFHTLFGLAGLSMLGFDGIEEVDPVFCMPSSIVKKFVRTCE